MGTSTAKGGTLHRSFIALVAIIAALSFASVAAAAGGTGTTFIVAGNGHVLSSPPKAASTPSSGMVVGCCDGGGSACQTVGNSRNDGFSYSDQAIAYFSYCFGGGTIWAQNGWDGQTTCQLLCQFSGFDSNYTFSNGHHTRANWSVVTISWILGVHINTSATACVAVDGWGNAWGC